MSEFDNQKYHFRLVCPFCGKIVHDDVPVPTKTGSFDGQCPNCNKIVINFHEAEKH